MSTTGNQNEGQRRVGIIDEYVASLTADDFAESTKTIRAWIIGHGVNTNRLVAELRYWANWFDDNVRSECD